MNTDNVRPLHANRSPETFFGAQEGNGQKKKFEAKGHDKQLENAQFGRKLVTIVTLDGATYSGTIIKRDRYTVTIQMEGEFECRMFFKSAIEQIKLPTPPVRTNVTAINEV